MEASDDDKPQQQQQQQQQEGDESQSDSVTVLINENRQLVYDQEVLQKLMGKTAYQKSCLTFI